MTAGRAAAAVHGLIKTAHRIPPLEDDSLRRSAGGGSRRRTRIGRPGRPISGGRQRNRDTDQCRTGHDKHAVAAIKQLGLAYASRFAGIQWR